MNDGCQILLLLIYLKKNGSPKSMFAIHIIESNYKVFFFETLDGQRT